MNKMLKIRQRKDDCHWETSIEEEIRTGHQCGWMPVVIGYGFTKESADTEALLKLKEK